MKRNSSWLMAFCGGGIFAVSTVLPGKLQQLAFHLLTSHHNGAVRSAEHVLQLIGCFMLLSVLIWRAERGKSIRNPLMSYPPRTKPMALAHIIGLLAGAAMLLSPNEKAQAQKPATTEPPHSAETAPGQQTLTLGATEGVMQCLPTSQQKSWRAGQILKNANSCKLTIRNSTQND